MIAPMGGWPRALALAAVAALAVLACTRASGAPPRGERIVTVGGAITETVFALGRGGAVVGRDSSSVYPAEVERLPSVGYQRTLAAEAILALEPDLVIAGAEAGPPAAIAQLRAAGVRVEIVAAAETVAAAAERIRAVGGVLERDADAGSLARLIEREASGAATSAAARPGPRVMFVYGRGGGTVMVAGHATAATAMIELAGATSAFTGYDGYKPLSGEAVVAAAPEVVLLPARSLATLGGLDGVLALPGVADTPAGRARRIVALDDLLLLGFGPRLPSAIDELARALREVPAP